MESGAGLFSASTCNYFRSDGAWRWGQRRRRPITRRVIKLADVGLRPPARFFLITPFLMELFASDAVNNRGFLKLPGVAEVFCDDHWLEHKIAAENAALTVAPLLRAARCPAVRPITANQQSRGKR